MPKHLKSLSTSANGKGSRSERMDKGLCRAQAKLEQRRKEREEFDRQAQEAAERKADQERDGKEVEIYDRRRGEEGKLKVERAKIKRLEEELQASTEEEIRLEQQLKEFQVVIDASRNRFGDTLHEEAVEFALVTSLTNQQSQYQEILETRARIKVLKDDIKDWENLKANTKTPTSLMLIDEAKLKELRKQSRASKANLDRLEKKLASVETARDNLCLEKLEAINKLSLLSKKKMDPECLLRQYARELTDASNSKATLAGIDRSSTIGLTSYLLTNCSEGMITNSKKEARDHVLKGDLVSVAERKLNERRRKELWELESQLETALRNKEALSSAQIAGKRITSSSSSERGSDSESSNRLAQGKAQKAFLQRLVSELGALTETIAELREENMKLLLQMSGIE